MCSGKSSLKGFVCHVSSTLSRGSLAKNCVVENGDVLDSVIIVCIMNKMI